MEDSKVQDMAKAMVELHEGFLGEIRVTRCALDTAEAFCNKALAELRPLTNGLKPQQVPASNEPKPPAPTVIVEDAELSTFTRPKRALETLAKYGVVRLSQLAKCRKGDLNILTDLPPASRKAIYRLTEEKGITLSEGRSFLEIIKLREACRKLASPAALKDHGHIIGYCQLPGNTNKWGFLSVPKFYFQAYDAAMTFLTRIGISDPSKELKLKLGVADLPTF